MRIGAKIFIVRQPGFTAGGYDSEEVITNIKTKYDEDTGDEYPVICVGQREFHGVSGYPLTPPWAYMIRMPIEDD